MGFSTKYNKMSKMIFEVEKLASTPSGHICPRLNATALKSVAFNLGKVHLLLNFTLILFV